jgi:hypothetical protein
MASEKPKVKKKTTVSRTTRGGVKGTLTTTRSSSLGKPKKTYAQFKAEGGDVSAAKSYNKSSESFRADAPKKVTPRGANVTPKTTPKPKLVPKVIPKPKTTPKPKPKTKPKKKKVVRKVVRNVVNTVKKAADKHKPKKKGCKLNCFKPK